MIYSAFILGLISSLHCIGMCGPIAMMLPVNHKNPTQKALQIILYHLGRISTYAFIGFIFGTLGRGFFLAGFQQKLSIFLGIIMILYVVFPKLTFNNIHINKPFLFVFDSLKSKLGKQFGKKTPQSFYFIGILNGFLPCGMLYIALFGALAMQTIFLGISYMILFGIGTIPMMSTVVYFSGFITPKFRNQIQKLIPVMVVCIGVLMILRGLGLDISHVSPSNLSLFIQAESNCK